MNAAQYPSQSDPYNAPTAPPLAVVGLSALFPKAATTDEFWSNIRRGVDSITEVPASHWDPADYFDSNQKTPDMTYARRGGFLSPVPFDPLEFGISPNNLEAIDTSQLLGLVGAKRALEHAGYGAGRQFDRSRVGCILGVTGTLEMVIPLGARLGHPRWKKALEEAGVPDDVAQDVIERISQSYVPWQENSFPGLLGNVVAGRIANRLDLHGTNCVVDAACASSLAAIHLAALELATGRSDMVVTGGVDTFNDIFMFMCFSKTPALSPSGDAKPFSDEADGTILGEGVGMLVLKRQADAERDGDRIYAVLKGIGTSSDGAGNAVYAPKAEGQIRCLNDAYRIAGVSPATVELVEAHGTGTKVGDATEVSGLMHVYQASGRRGAWCAVGSVKSQIGHTKAAAGAAGVIKAILALQHRVLPPTVKVGQPPAAFLNDQSPFYVNTIARPWVKPSGYPRRAAVSAFGFGGSNFHCVLEESPQRFDEPEWDGDVQVVALSADSANSLSEKLKSQVQPLAASEWRATRAFAAASRQSFRADHPCRLVFAVERDKTDLAKLTSGALTMLERYPEKRSWSTPDGVYYGTGHREGKLGILFPGQGSQYVGMMRDLVCRFPSMLETLDEANEVFAAASPDIASNKRLSDFIYPHPGFSTEDRNRQEAELRSTQVAQPAIGAVSLALLSMLDRFGIQPEAVAGHSYGELTALCASSRFSPRVLYRLSSLRGRLMAAAQETDGGMLAVLAPLAQIEAALTELSLDLVVANHNSPSQVVLSGRIPDIDRAESLFASRKIRGKKLPVAAAFHSPLVAPASSEFRPVLEEVDFAPPSMPVYANSTATQYPAEPAAARDLLANQLARPVHWVNEIEQMYADGVRTFMEVGPGGVLTGLVNSILDNREYRAIAVDGSNGKRDGLYDLACALSNLAASGYAVRWDQWDPAAAALSAPEETRRLRIPISGANYFKPREPIPARPKLKLAESCSESGNGCGISGGEKSRTDWNEGKGVVPQTTQETLTDSNSTLTDNPAFQSTIQAHSNSPTEPLTVSGTSNAETVEVIREALAALQKMQQETSRLHQRFLDEQASALDTLAKLASGQFGGRLANELQADGVPSPTVDEPEAADIRNYYEIRREDLSQDNGLSDEQSQLLQSFAFDLGTEQYHATNSDGVPVGVALVPGSPFERIEAKHEADLRAMQELPVTELPAFATSGLQHDPNSRLNLSVPGSGLADLRATTETPIAQSVSPLAETVLAVVSEKTGYPTEMLKLDMSLDHDLGIDSIKRVEILSALQERVENLPAFQPEELGSLHTLQDVVALADSRMPTSTLSPAVSAPVIPQHHQFAAPAIQSPAAPVSSPPLAAAQASTNHLGQVSLADTVLQVVSEKTGYPIEMLNLEMSLDHDLGIDSIKRVEILSAMQERVTDLPAFQPEELGSLHTLKDVVTLADARLPGIASHVSTTTTPEQQPREIAAAIQPQATATTTPHFAAPAPTNLPGQESLADTVLQVVSEKTGYPIEMLNLEMSLDHDLGIDSIKRVEILSAMQERVTNLPAFQPEELGSLHTLKDVVALADARVSGQPATTKPASVAVASTSSSSPAAAALPRSNHTNHAAVPVIPVVERTVPVTSAAPGLGEKVLAVVSEKTGYPVEMLVLDMSLDHDLGIDSIKRVEILSALQEKVPNLPAFQPEELGSLHTLRDVVNLADSRVQGTPASAMTAFPASPATAVVSADFPSMSAQLSPQKQVPSPFVPSHQTPFASSTSVPALSALMANRDLYSAITRSVVQSVAIPPAATRTPLNLTSGSDIWITEDGLGLSLLVAGHLKQHGYKPRIVALDDPRTNAIPERLSGLIIIAPQHEMDEIQLWHAVEWLKKVGPTLRRMGAKTGALFATVSRLDGQFGFGTGKKLRDPVSGGLAGLAKCAALEWPEVTSRAFDISGEWSAAHVAAAMLATELMHKEPREVGLTSSGPHALEVVDEPLVDGVMSPPVNPGDVILVTGGARGVTAETVFAMANAWRPRLVILGRSPGPALEPEWLSPLSSEAEIKQALIARIPNSTPKAINQQYQQIVAAREVTRQLQRLRSTGASAIYHSVDIRDPSAVKPLLTAIQRDFGVIRGIVHGAGVLADQRIEDKTWEQFERVYRTKVTGLRTLLECVDASQLRMLSLFSSYTARYGRVGQVDYAIANEVLNKQARQFAILNPLCRVASFNWGPWDGGMVQGGLKKLFASEGVDLIPIEAGADALVREFSQNTTAPIEVLVLGKDSSSTSSAHSALSHPSSLPTPHAAAALAAAVAKTIEHGVPAEAKKTTHAEPHDGTVRPAGATSQAGTGPHDGGPDDVTAGHKVAFERVLDVAHHPFLESHVIGGRAVLPVAVMLEWLAHGAIHGNPGLDLHGFDEFKVFQGIRIGRHNHVQVRVMCGKPIRDNDNYRVPVRLMGHVDGRDTVNARAVAILAPSYPSAPGRSIQLANLGPYSLDVSSSYAHRLFHGQKLKGIASIEGCSEEGIIVTSRMAPPATAWMSDPVRASWLADPLAIDVALQAVILWSQERRGKPCLPCGIASYRQFRRSLPLDGIRIIIKIQPPADRMIRCDIEFVDLRGHLVARMEGCENVIDASLSAAFKRNRIEA